MKGGIVFSLVCLVLFSSVVMAELAITEPDEIYMLGDKLFVTATGLKGSETGNLNIDLICSNKTVNLLKFSARAFSEEGGESYSIPYKILSAEDLEINNIKSIVGKCRIKANLAKEVVESKSFTVSDKLTVHATIDKIKYNPGDDAMLIVDVKRADGELFDGFFEISNFSNDEGEIVEGRVEHKINVKGDLAPGQYFLNFNAYSRNSEKEITNNGSARLFVIVNQIATLLEPVISDLEVTPGNELRLSPKILDQAGSTMEGRITVHLTDPEERKYDYNVLSGETLNVKFPTNSTQGAWHVYYVYHEMTAESEFSMLGVERVNYTLENSILRIKNVGNIDYFGNVKIDIGESTQELEVKLGVGQIKEFILEAPEGEYEININDGENSFSGTGFLTGNAVGVREMGSTITSSFSYMWIFLIFLVGSLGVVMVGMYRRKNKTVTKTTFKEKIKGLGRKFRRKKKIIDPTLEEPIEDKDIIDLTKQGEMKNAESALVLNGEKLKSVVVSIKIKDKDDFAQDIQHDVVGIIKTNCGTKGVVDVKEDYIYLIYSPLITRSYRNEFSATSVALNIAKSLNEYRKKLSGDLNFGMGVNSGELVSKKVGVKLKYTSIGNIFSYANKLSEMAENTVYISSLVRKEQLRDIKAKKVHELNKMPVYEVEEIKDKAKNEAKLKDLLSRMDDTKTKK